MQQMHYIDSYALNKNVFSLFVNVSSDMSGMLWIIYMLWITYCL